MITEKLLGKYEGIVKYEKIQSYPICQRILDLDNDLFLIRLLELSEENQEFDHLKDDNNLYFNTLRYKFMMSNCNESIYQALCIIFPFRSVDPDSVQLLQDSLKKIQEKYQGSLPDNYRTMHFGKLEGERNDTDTSLRFTHELNLEDPIDPELYGQYSSRALLIRDLKESQNDLSDEILNTARAIKSFYLF